MSDLQPLLDRSRYTDEEWQYATSGRCGWGALALCGYPSSPGSVYRFCAEHDVMAREHGLRYGQ